MGSAPAEYKIDLDRYGHSLMEGGEPVGRPRCQVQDKAQFRSLNSAMEFIANHKQWPTRRKHRMGAYRCKHCDDWHITSHFFTRSSRRRKKRHTASSTLVASAFAAFESRGRKATLASRTSRGGCS